MTQEIKTQFTQFVENHINNPFVEERLFTSYDNLGEFDSIFLAVESNGIKFLFEYNCCFTTEEGTNLYEFNFYEKK